MSTTIDGFRKRKLTNAIVVHKTPKGSIIAIGDNGLKMTILQNRFKGKVEVGDSGEIWFSVIGRSGDFSFLKTSSPKLTKIVISSEHCIFCGRVFVRPQQRVHARRREVLREYWGFKCRKLCDTKPRPIQEILRQGSA